MTRKILCTALALVLLHSMTACTSAPDIQPKADKISRKISPQQSLSAPDVTGTIQDSTVAEAPVGNTDYSANASFATQTNGGNVDYSVYEPYGLLYDQENHYYTYNGNVVRFFYDPMAGASFTNFFSGIMDIEAEYDSNNKLICIKECSKEVYDRHTQKANRIGSLTEDEAVEAGETSSKIWLKDYVDYGVTYDTQSDTWYYNGQRIKILLDSEQARIYTDEENGNGICISVIRNNNNEISGIKEISEQDAQFSMQNNNLIRNDYNYSIQE